MKIRETRKWHRFSSRLKTWLRERPWSSSRHVRMQEQGGAQEHAEAPVLGLYVAEADPNDVSFGLPDSRLVLQSEAVCDGNGGVYGAICEGDSPVLDTLGWCAWQAPDAVSDEPAAMLTDFESHLEVPELLNGVDARTESDLALGLPAIADTDFTDIPAPPPRGEVLTANATNFGEVFNDRASI